MKSAEKQARAKASRNFLILAHLIASLSSYCWRNALLFNSHTIR